MRGVTNRVPSAREDVERLNREIQHLHTLVNTPTTNAMEPSLRGKYGASLLVAIDQREQQLRMLESMARIEKINAVAQARILSYSVGRMSRYSKRGR